MTSYSTLLNAQCGSKNFCKHMSLIPCFFGQNAGHSGDSFASVDLASRFKVQFVGCSLNQMSGAFN